jgi:hypothetical protein
MIITILNQAGFSRASGLASHLAMLRTNAGRNVLLIYPKSFAPSRVSKSAWEAIETKLSAVAYVVPDECLQAEIQNMSPFYNDIVIEEKTRISPEGRSTLAIADIAIVQIQPGNFGLEIRDKLMKRIEAAQRVNPSLRVLVAIIGASEDFSIRDLQSAENFVAGIRSGVLVNTLADNLSVTQGMLETVAFKPRNNVREDTNMSQLYRSIFVAEQVVPASPGV